LRIHPQKNTIFCGCIRKKWYFCIYQAFYMITRAIEKKILSRLYKGKAIILLGARQTGKTTLLHKITQQQKKSVWLNADDPEVQAIFESPTAARLNSIFKNKNLVIIDEAQQINNIGQKLKLITDTNKNIQIIATGSSAFELANKINEPLTGRKWEFSLFPFSFKEMVDEHGLLEERKMLYHRLVFGYYPEVVNNAGNEIEILKSLTDSYLYKDILMHQNIQKPDKLIKLLQALSFQIGNQVSYSELGKLVGMNNETVEKYIQLLEQTFIIYRLGSFSRNLRNELKGSRKIYFYDNGMRNALIANFNPVELRQDIGALWENFMITERMKTLRYENTFANSYFWRTREQQEIDYIEEKGGTLTATEFKWNAARKINISKTFTRNYPNSTTQVIHPGNFEEFLDL
jgi:predicted AAA+ superfamily ATPase